MYAVSHRILSRKKTPSLKQIAPQIAPGSPIALPRPPAIVSNPPPSASVETTVPWFAFAVPSLFDLGTVSYRSVLGRGVQSSRLPLSIQQRSLAVSTIASVIPSWPSRSSSVLAQQLLAIALERQMLHLT